jgi:DNA-binding NarL/FixJ family response regulator
VATERIRVVVIDDHDLFRGGMVQLLREHGVETVAEARLAAEGIELVCRHAPDVVLMDLNMPGMSGIEATQRLQAAAPLARVLVLTVVDDEHAVTEAMLAGAFGYLLKDAPIAQTVEGIRAAARGEAAIAPRVATHLVRRLRRPSQPVPATVEEGQLTPRELEILELIARGMDNSEIARVLFLSQHTVKNHVSSILVKMQVENRIQAAVRAVRRGLL